jgi:VWFA-related protein
MSQLVVARRLHASGWPLFDRDHDNREGERNAEEMCMSRAVNPGIQTHLPNRIHTVLRIVLVAASMVLASEAGAQPRFDETIEVRLLEIDARVVDRDGNPVHGLGFADFVLFEDGRRVDIESVYEVRATPAVVAAADAATEATLAPAPVTRTKPRTIVFFLDQLPLNAVERKEMFRDLAEFAHTALREGDMTAVFGWALEARRIVPLTRNHQTVIEMFDAMAGDLDSLPGTMLLSQKAALVESTAAAIAEGGSSAGWNFNVEEERVLYTSCVEEVLAEMRRKTTTLKTIVSALQGDRTAALVYVSNRMPENAATYCSNLGRRSPGVGPVDNRWSTTSLLRDLGRTANAAGVTLYSLRPHVPKTMNDASESGPPGAGSAAIRDSVFVANELYSLGVLAEVTGGVVGYSPKEIKVALATIESDLDSYYSIAWRSTSDGRDRERKIRIETKNETLTVRARRTLVDKSDLTRAKDTLVGNLHGVEDSGDFQVSMRAIGETATRKRRKVRTEVRFRPESLTFVERGNRRVATYRVMILSSDESGALSEWTEETRDIVEPEDKAKPLALEFDLEMRPEGTMTAIGIFDETTGIAGFAMLDTRVSAKE